MAHTSASTADSAAAPSRRRPLRLWLAFLLVIGAGVALAWLGTSSVRANTVQVETLTAGSGPAITVNDGVLIEYEGRLDNGTMFDSSGDRGPVPLLVGQTVPGFAQALTRMQKGGKYRIRIPSQLAYGANPPPGGPIPANADLNFDVTVVQVVPNAALMQGAPPQN